MSRYRNIQVGGKAVMKHVAAAERALGKPLPDGAEVHHVDGDTLNSANANLVICQDNGYHKLLHLRAEVVSAGGDPNTQKFCRKCGCARPFAAFNRARNKSVIGLTSACRECSKDAFSRWWRAGGAAKHSARRRQRHSENVEAKA